MFPNIYGTEYVIIACLGTGESGAGRKNKNVSSCFMELIFKVERNMIDEETGM